MPMDRAQEVLAAELARLGALGTRKGEETEFRAVLPAAGDRGPRFLVRGAGDREFLRMNSNSYLGLSLAPEVIRAEEEASRDYGVGPGAVRFISGTYSPHVELERRLARFHGREAGMIFSSAYATTLAVLGSLITAETAVVSDELNHNCIINAVRMARPREKHVYRHLDFAALGEKLELAAGACRRAIVVTDGIFSMRGDHADLAALHATVARYDPLFPENVLVMVDDSHGVGAFGATGRGTEEHAAAPPSDVLVATLGKAIGVNGGYVVGSRTLVDYLRETAALYIYSNPITVGEAAAALAALEILDSARGRELLAHLSAMTRRFESGLVALGYETIPGAHPVVPLMVRDTARTSALVRHLRAHGVLATGLNYPVVPRGDEEIRFQISADHTPADIDFALGVLASFPERGADRG
ncbi:MAG: aminotransferase class I/II-fold pyridoxal phosphate-dependent enzyme [Acidobacteriota bacterium]|nr:aminotransferase class I/II-fold pyridoxal phosphate-dependent enzyme [Acidobacteriota bacterium]MDH3523289.1 aminotransferase class I/II-fold pyridoxal phosphate-dependent enzyme [Acidobacteriota bacterium]